MAYQALIAILLALWALDGYLTIGNIKKYGTEIEENPILKQLLRHNVKYFLFFKLADAIAFGIIILLIINKSESIAIILLTAFVILYSYVNLKNYSVYKELKD